MDINQLLAALSDHQTFYCVLEACKLSSNSRTAAEIHARIIRFGYRPYPSLIANLISTYAHCDRLNLARQLLDQIFVGEFDLVFVNMIIGSLMEAGECGLAKKVFYKMPTRDTVTWNSIIGGCVRNSRFEEALRFFREMLSSNVEPDAFTFAPLLSGCARLGSLYNAQWVHTVMIEKNIEQNHILGAALVDMYSKCGRIQSAKEIFCSVRRNDVSVWNAMINGLASHGLGLDAIAIFLEMELEKASPDSITFLGILKACSHCGLVEEGRKYFDQMRSYYSIMPQLHHYGAMVDLLGRAGLLEEAFAVIDSMPMEPDIVIYRALLSACRTYKKPELGEAAIVNISHLRSGDYVLLSNIYCSINRWNSAERVREAMKKTGVRKNRGKSWVELVGTIHQFKAGDRSHPETEAIYGVLEGLIQRIKFEGFASVTELVLMDVSDEEKGESLNYHSEKLALAFAILKTSPGKEIRIFKNLRICHDCHCWIKVVSTVLSRVIIVRDRIRFHRFQGGFCSCGDYW